jgi:hypothetical protein
MADGAAKVLSGSQDKLNEKRRRHLRADAAILDCSD